MAEKQILGKNGQHFVFFYEENVTSRMRKKNSWKKMGSILSFFMRKILQVEWPKNFLEKIGQHFLPVYEEIFGQKKNPKIPS